MNLSVCRDRGHSRPLLRRPLRVLTFVAMTMVCSFPVLPPHSVAAAVSPHVGAVEYILHGLAMQPPKKTFAKAWIHQDLFAADTLRTEHQQLASITFNDGSILHLDQNTDALLRTPGETDVKYGTLGQIVVPGTRHRVETRAAVAAAVGTEFFVTVAGSTSVFTVQEGALTVSNKYGTVVVTTGEQSTVQVGQAPESPVKSGGNFAWSDALPPFGGSMGMNVALIANGAQVVGGSLSAVGAWQAASLFDGSLTTGWLAGQISNQQVTVQLAHGKTYVVSGVVLDCAAPPGVPPSNAPYHFIVGVSLTSGDAATFKQVYSGVCGTADKLLRFHFSQPVLAKYVEFTAVDNHGGSDGIGFRELEVVTTPAIGTPAESNCGDLGCMDALLAMNNAVRARYHLRPLRLNLTQSLGTGECAGAYGHSVAMAKTGAVWHTYPGYDSTSYPRDICIAHSLSRENVGEYQDSTTLKSLRDIMATDMGNPHDAKTCATVPNHACNLINPAFSSVGIGIYKTGSKTWVTEDFIK